VLLIGNDGTDHGIVTLPDALSIARETGFDLVEVAANADLPVCRLMHFAAWQREQEQRRRVARRGPRRRDDPGDGEGGAAVSAKPRPRGPGPSALPERLDEPQQ
jgi:hypothetical protein